MKVENPAALRFILQDEIYLLNDDKAAYSLNAAAQTVSQPVADEMSSVAAQLLPPPVTETQPVNFNYLGGHKKNFLVIAHYPELDFMDEKHLNALQSTLKRLGFELEDVAIINRAKYAHVSFEVLAEFFKPKKMLLLGAHALPAGIDSLKLNATILVNNCNMLYTFSFEEMMESNDKKKAFWEQMKQL